MADFKAGQYIVYMNGDKVEIGKIKRIARDGAFVYYHEGDTAAKTPFDCMMPIINAYTIKDTSLGGERSAETVPVKPLCEWLSKYTIPPMFAYDAPREPVITSAEKRAEVWEYAIRKLMKDGAI